jgi:hypothetical protein
VFSFADLVILALPGATLFVLPKLTKTFALSYKGLLSISFFFLGQALHLVPEPFCRLPVERVEISSQFSAIRCQLPADYPRLAHLARPLVSF